MSAVAADVTDKVVVRPSPFPGLRPFEAQESYLFFGRDGQSQAVIDLLAAEHFVAVVGTSGSGKSSLVRAGVIPSLRRGLMAAAGSEWRIAVMRPGNDPIRNLARALNGVDAFGPLEGTVSPIQMALTEAVLRRGNRGLVDFVQQNSVERDANVLVLVDQFEELFRFQREAARSESGNGNYQNEAAAFVKLLLEASRPKTNIYVMLTMRSDYLGDCAQFWGLPEAINDSQYLIPRLTRAQLREAITGPIAVNGGAIAARLVVRLLNDIGDNQDQLPVLQHLLMRMWNESQELRLPIEIKVEGETVRQQHQAVHEGAAMDLCCYEAVGGMAEALSRHADEAFIELPDDGHRQVAGKAFRALTEKGADNREIRRPVTVEQICAVTRASESEVRTIVEAFRRSGRSFLLVTPEGALDRKSLVDVSHESLIRRWCRLKEWVDEECASVRDYHRLTDFAARNKSGKAGLWDDPDLQMALNWKASHEPNEDWAARYGSGYKDAMQFLEDSKLARDQKRAEKAAAAAKLRFWFRIACAALVVALIGFGIALIARGAAVQEKERVDKLRYVSNVGLAYQNFLSGNSARAVQILNLDLPDSTSTNKADLRGFLWYYLWKASHKERLTLTGHSGPVGALTFSRDGRWLATASEDKTIKLWDAQTWQEVATLSGHTDFVRALAFSRDGKTLASASEDKTVRLWDIDSRRPQTLPLSRNDQNVDINVRALAFSPDGKTLAIGADNDKAVRVWDLVAQQERKLAGHDGGIRSLAFSADGRLLASGSNDKKFKLWDVASSQAIYTSEEQNGSILALAFSPTEQKLALSVNDKLVKLWNVSQAAELAFIKEHSDVYSLAFSPDGKFVAASGLDGTVRMRSPNNLDEVARISGHSNGVLAVAFSPDGKTLASGGVDAQVKLTDSSAWQAAPATVSDPQKMFAIAFSPDGQTLAAATYGAVGEKDVKDPTASIRLLSVNLRRDAAAPLRFQGTLAARSLAFTRDGRLLLAGLSDGTVQAWQASDWSLVDTINAHYSGSEVKAVACSPDGHSFVTGSLDYTAKVWDLNNRSTPRQTLTHPAGILTVAYSPDGKIIATAAYDAILRLWDANSGQLLFKSIKQPRAIESLAFSPDGKTLAAGDFYGNVGFWEVETRQLAAARLANYGGVLALTFSPDGKNLVSAGYDNSVKLWDVESMQEIVTLSEDAHGVYAVAFSNDGKTLASAGFDRTIKLWQAASDEDVAKQKK